MIENEREKKESKNEKKERERETEYYEQAAIQPVGALHEHEHVV